MGDEEIPVDVDFGEEDTGKHHAVPIDPHDVMIQILETVTRVESKVDNATRHLAMLETTVELLRGEVKVHKSELSRVDRRIDDLEMAYAGHRDVIADIKKRVEALERQ